MERGVHAASALLWRKLLADRQNPLFLQAEAA
jgi:hypothetical protein